jgi:DNA-binding Lrp family transcriptional regulator
MPRPSRHAEIDLALLAQVAAHPRDLVTEVASQVGVSRQTVVARVRALIADGRLAKSGSSTRPLYALGPRRVLSRRYPLTGLAEDAVWRNDVAPLLAGVASNVLDICHYGLTEMVNNAIDHSGGQWLTLDAWANEDQVVLIVGDDGVGIFRKIAQHLGLADERLALLELAKGKLTTDPARHTGEGVFFTSRVFDRFVIRSGGLLFNHDDVDPDDVLRDHDHEQTGTQVTMMIARNATRTLRSVFERYSSGPDDYTFERTVVPVRLARIGEENLVSRSQAKRLLQRVDRFRRVVLDFTGVALIGQGFADEVFRVFANAHPEVELSAVNAEPDVRAMIARAGGRIDADSDGEDAQLSTLDFRE